MAQVARLQPGVRLGKLPRQLDILRFERPDIEPIACDKGPGGIERFESFSAQVDVQEFL